MRQGYPFLLLLLNIVLEVLASTQYVAWGNKGINIGKEEIKLYLFADNMTACRKLLKYSSASLEIRCEFSKVARQRTYNKNQLYTVYVHLYTINNQLKNKNF